MKNRLLFPILSLMLICWQPKDNTASIHVQIQEESNRIFPKLIGLRRDLHAHPELAGNESRTAGIISRQLQELGLEVKTATYGQSVVGILHGARPGPSIVWRTDMDAIRSNFPDQETFKSTIKGIQHHCGHDVHVAVGLGIAEVLAKQKNDLKGTVYFIFQPEEETFAGARGLLNAGLFEDIRPDEIYGLHVTDLPLGRIAVKAGEIFAWQRGLHIKLNNSLSSEQIKSLSQTIQNSLARNSHGGNPRDIQQISHPQSGMLSLASIFRDYRFLDGLRSSVKNDELHLEGYIYETQEEKLKEIIPIVSRLIEQQHPGVLRSVSFNQENPTVLNNSRLTNSAIKTLRKLYGENRVAQLHGQAPYFNDDFAYFQQRVPGVYFLLGGSNKEKGLVAMNHAPGFRVDEECLRVGVSVFSSLLVSRL